MMQTYKTLPKKSWPRHLGYKNSNRPSQIMIFSSYRDCSAGCECRSLKSGVPRVTAANSYEHREDACIISVFNTRQARDRMEGTPAHIHYRHFTANLAVMERLPLFLGRFSYFCKELCQANLVWPFDCCIDSKELTCSLSLACTRFYILNFRWKSTSLVFHTFHATWLTTLWIYWE